MKETVRLPSSPRGKKSLSFLPRSRLANRSERSRLQAQENRPLCASRWSSPTDVPQDVSARSPQGLHTLLPWALGLRPLLPGPSAVLPPADWAAMFGLTRVCRRERSCWLPARISALGSAGLRCVSARVCGPVSLGPSLPFVSDNSVFKREKRTRSITRLGLAHLEGTGLKGICFPDHFLPSI